MLRPLKHLFFTQLALSSALYAQDNSPLLDDFFSDVSSMTNSPSESTPFQTETKPLPAPSIEKQGHYTVSGELLYLKPGFDSLPWLYSSDNTQLNNPNSSSTTFSQQDTDLEVMNLPFDFGFRLAAGFNSTWLNLELLLTWERFYTHGTNKLGHLSNTATTAYNQPTAYSSYWDYPAVTIEGQIYEAKNTIKFHWNKIDLTAAIPLKGNNRFIVSPLIGLRGLVTNFSSAITTPTNRLGNSTTTVSTTLVSPSNYTLTKLQQKFNAIGLVGGLNGDVNCGQGFHINALLDAAIVYGQLHSHIYNNKFQAYTAQDPFIASFTTKPNRFVPIVDIQATAYWNKAFYDNKMNLYIHLGYEAHWLPNFFEYLNPKDNDRRSFFDLSLQGLNAGIGLSF